MTMTATEPVEILLSREKLTKTLIAAAVFVAMGILFIVSPRTLQTTLFSPTVIVIIGIFSVSFFGICGVIILKKMQDKRPGLIIDGTGITDNASGISAGHIPWHDIKEIKISQVMSQKFFMILVNNPNDYISRQTNMLKRKTAEMNYKSYGSPISISTNSLKCSFGELQSILQTRLEKNKPVRA